MTINISIKRDSSDAMLRLMHLKPDAQGELLLTTALNIEPGSEHEFCFCEGELISLFDPLVLPKTFMLPMEAETYLDPDADLTASIDSTQFVQEHPQGDQGQGEHTALSSPGSHDEAPPLE